MKDNQLILSTWIFILFSAVLCLSFYSVTMITKLVDKNEVLIKQIEWQDRTIGDMSIEMGVYKDIILMDYVAKTKGFITQ